MPEDRAKAYTEAGVDINAGNTFVKRIKDVVANTHSNAVLSDIGGFGGLFKPDLGGMEEPVLVSGTDGVGTKLKLAFQFDRHETIGIDLVAMSVNDILVQGAKPLFFLDYFATGKLDVEKAQTVVAGIAEGCRQAHCALLGGETAEMADMYGEGEYDLAGFCVGVVDNANIVDGSSIRVGDVVIGLGSTGVHSNGYTLVRKLFEQSGLKGEDIFPGTEKSVADVLMEPTAIYVETVRNLLRDFDINGMVHITGGGFYDNLPRVLPQGVEAHIEFGAWNVAPVFQWLKEQGDLSWPEMLQIFNCGIGYVLIVSKEQAEDIMARLEALQQQAWVIGTVGRRSPDTDEQVVMSFPPDDGCECT